MATSYWPCLCADVFQVPCAGQRQSGTCHEGAGFDRGVVASPLSRASRYGQELRGGVSVQGRAEANILSH